MKHKFRKNALYALCFRLRGAKGQSLIEAMVAIGIIVFGILSTLGLLSRALSLNRVVSDQFTATYLAAEGIEVVKNLIDANIIQGRPWNSGLTTGSFEADYNSLLFEPNQGRRLLLDLASGHYSYDGGNPTSFVRTINIELIGSEEIKVSPVVAWRTRGGGNFEVRLEDHFFNWR